VLTFGESLLVWAISTGGAALAGLLLALVVGKYLKSIYFLAFAAGILLWVFTDVINEAGQLDVEASFSGGWEQFIIVALFIIGILSFVFVDRSTFSTVVASAGANAALLLAVAVGVHGLGEGLSFGAVAATTPFSSIIIAFGGEGAGAAYVIHKFLEAVAIGSFYMTTQTRPSPSIHLRNVALLTLVFILPSVVAAGIGYYIQFDSVYLFSLGTGALLYAIMKVAGPLFSAQSLGPGTSFKIGLWLTVGFLCVYFAALFHAYVP
jgi:hypothetical protein